MKRTNFQPPAKQAVYTKEEVLNLLWGLLEEHKDNSSYLIYTDFVASAHARLLLLDMGCCKHGFKDSDECSDCRH